MSKYIEKIEKQIVGLEAKINELSGEHLTNTWKRMREQQERDQRKEELAAQLQIMQYLKNKAETEALSPFEQQLTVATFYEEIRCLAVRYFYCKEQASQVFSYPKYNEKQIKRLKKANITTTEELETAIIAFDNLRKLAVTPVDQKEKRLRKLLYEAKMSQGGDIQFTPEPLAKELVAISGITSDSLVLEPEAGIGSIADAAREITGSVYCIERQRLFCEILALKNYSLLSTDLMKTEAEDKYDAVLMNPPFSEECEHIQKAYEFVRPGGTLTAICSNSVTWKSTNKYKTFREWLSGSVYEFITPKESNFEMTGVNTVILNMRKPAA